MQVSKSSLGKYLPFEWHSGEFCAEILGTFVLMVINNAVIAMYLFAPDNKFPPNPLAMVND